MAAPDRRDPDDLTGYYIEDLKEGMVATFAKTVTETDITLFAGITGDVNPVHTNREYAYDTMFKGRIAHGMLTASFISTVLGTKLPGPGCIYMSQTLQFKAPVRDGDTAHAKVVVKEIDRVKNRVLLETTVSVSGKPVVVGEALLLVPSKKSKKKK